MINLLQFLENAKTPQSKKDIVKAGFTNVKEELKRLMKTGLVERHEEYAHNTTKKYFNKDAKKFETYAGTRFYTYSLVQK